MQCKFSLKVLPCNIQHSGIFNGFPCSFDAHKLCIAFIRFTSIILHHWPHNYNSYLMVLIPFSFTADVFFDWPPSIFLILCCVCLSWSGVMSRLAICHLTPHSVTLSLGFGCDPDFTTTERNGVSPNLALFITAFGKSTQEKSKLSNLSQPKRVDETTGG